MLVPIAFMDPPAQSGEILISDALSGLCVEPEFDSVTSSKGCVNREFIEIYREHRGYVASLLLRFGVSSADVDDVAQEVFLTLHDRMDEYDPELASIRSWLYGIARRRAANERRRGARHQKKLAQRPAQRMFITEAELRRREAGRLVDRFIKALDPERAEVFSMIDVQGRSAPEVAEWLGVNLNTVYTRLRSARQRFAEFVRGIESEGALAS